MAKRTEQQIMEKWQRRGRPVVSVVCVTYNHERYLPEAIESFLSQSTDFPIEIIIHDDASTDSSQHTIRRYAQDYPHLIRPILQSDNQQRLGKNAFLIACAQAAGEYIALCEGDDYWSDPDKLQIQVGEMRRHAACGISFHCALMMHEQGTLPGETLGRYGRRNRIFSPGHIILRDGGFMPSSSICLKREVLDEMREPKNSSLPGLLYDYFLQIYGSLPGGALYISKEMSVYRYLSAGSWSELMTSDGDYYLGWMRRNIEAIKQVDELTGGEYTREFRSIIRKRHGSILRSPLLSLAVRGGHYQQQREEAGFLNLLLWHTLYRHDRLNRFLAQKLPLLRRVRSAILSCHLRGSVSA